MDSKGFNKVASRVNLTPQTLRKAGLSIKSTPDDFIVFLEHRAGRIDRHIAELMDDAVAIDNEVKRFKAVQ